MNNLPTQETFNAYFARPPAQGFYITEIEIEATGDAKVSLKNIKRIHAPARTEIDLDRDGNVEIKA